MFEVPRQRHIKALATPDDQIRKIPHRAMVVHGRDDKIVPPTNSTKLHSLLKNSDLHMFSNCGHWTQIERKNDFNKLVLDFFAA
jgi:pimeloyl-ACP methyl ester carboxylesterase